MLYILITKNYSLYTLRNSEQNIEALYTVRNKTCLISFIKLSLRLVYIELSK